MKLVNFGMYGCLLEDTKKYVSRNGVPSSKNHWKAGCYATQVLSILFLSKDDILYKII